MVPNFLIENFAQLQNYLQNHTKSHYIINILAITADNHIITQQSGIHPIRRNAESGTYIKDGTTTEHDWIGLVPPEDRMNSFDPPKGYIIHANNRLA
jgi:penicillin amidase